MLTSFQEKIHNLPNEVQHHILSYTYCPKPTDLLIDIRNNVETYNVLYDYVDHLEFIGRHYFITAEDEVHNEILNFIFYNLYDGRMETVGNLFWKRSPAFFQISKRRPHLSIDKICHRLLERLYIYPINTQIRILWGLLFPHERDVFIKLYSTEYYDIGASDSDSDSEIEFDDDFDF
jgi:hypothetical protein